MKRRRNPQKCRFKTYLDGRGRGVLAASFEDGRRCEHAHIAVKVRLEQAGRRPLRILRRSAAPRRARQALACILKDTRILMYPDISQTYLTCLLHTRREYMYLERFLGVTLDSVARRLARTYSTTNRGGIPSRQCDPFPWAYFLCGCPKRHARGSAPLRD